jgi:N-formylglutamate deformylase
MREVSGEFDPPFELLEPPALAASVVFNSPHSGRVYPSAFLAASRLEPATLRRSEDSFVDELFLGVVPRGAPLLRAHFPRAYLDVNREPYELDPRMFAGRLPHFANTRSVRVAGGLGTIARIVAEAEEIYARPLPVEEALQRIERLHKPYHRALGGVLGRVRSAFGAVLLVDCHSMPSSVRGSGERTRADFVIGDRYGTSCAPEVVDVIHGALSRLGYAVLRNKPYAGGYITEQYGTPAHGFHAVQIEVNRALYLDEARYEPSHGFGAVAADLMRMTDELLALDLAGGWRAEAAE